MLNLIKYAQTLVYSVLGLMPSQYQRRSLEALLGLMLEAKGQALPEHSRLVSSSSLSRFLNHYHWSTRAVIRAVRREIITQVKAQDRYGCPPVLQVILDLTTLEKTGKFPQLESLIRRYHSKWGLHIVVLYLVVGEVQLPWGFRVYRGPEGRTPVELAQRLILSLPQELTERFELRVLGDTAFGTIELLQWVKTRPRLEAVVGIRRDRRLVTPGRSVQDVARRGQQVSLLGLKFPVTLSWYWLHREDGTKEKRFVVSTAPLSATYITRLGRKRWRIECFFKVAKHRFSLHRFGQATHRGVYRWIILSFLAYFLAHCAARSMRSRHRLDWAAAAQLALETLFPAVVIQALIVTIRYHQPLARMLGIDLSIRACASA